MNNVNISLQSSCESERPIASPIASPSASQLEDITVTRKKKRDKKSKKEKKHHRSITPISANGSNQSDVENSGTSSRNAEEQALSETELESKRAALLAQLNEQMED